VLEETQSGARFMLKKRTAEEEKYNEKTKNADKSN
jgi:hypothetical protein